MSIFNRSNKNQPRQRTVFLGDDDNPYSIVEKYHRKTADADIELANAVDAANATKDNLSDINTSDYNISLPDFDVDDSEKEGGYSILYNRRSKDIDVVDDTDVDDNINSDAEDSYDDEEYYNDKYDNMTSDEDEYAYEDEQEDIQEDIHTGDELDDDNGDELIEDEDIDIQEEENETTLSRLQDTSRYKARRTSNKKRHSEDDNDGNIKAAGKKKKKGRVKTIILAILAVLFGLLAAGSIVATSLVSSWLQDLPDYKSLDTYDQTGITTIYAADKKTVLAEITLTNRIHSDSDQIDPNAKNALVAVEDERFYEHGAVDPIGIARAIFVNVTGGSTQGASTLTQQLVRNTILLNEMEDRTLQRKVREMYIAMKLEEEYSKDDILTAYLNVVNFGNGNYGIEAASRDYFGHSADNLSVAEAAFLVGIPNSPTKYDPKTDYDATVSRMNTVLYRMLDNGYITQEEYDEAIANPPVIVTENQTDNIADIAPYFVDYVKQLLRENTNNKYGLENNTFGGYSVYTTLDVKDQNAANAAIADTLSDSDLDASLTSVDPDNGYIVAMVGGRDYKADNYNLSTQMARQPGSTFKPFTLIAAMQLGMSPDTRVDSSSPAKITDEWTVKNSGGGSYGWVDLRYATAQSLNTVYARVAHEIGAQAIVDTAHAMGIKSDLDAVESISLGTQGVNTLEMASAYATIAAGGIYREPVAITKIETVDKETIYEVSENPGVQVISPEIAYLATQCMQGVIQWGTGTGARLASGQVAAGKTGTSENGRDLWFVGFTPQLSTAVWTGYRQEQDTPLYGGTTSTPIWKKYMDVALEDSEIESWEEINTGDVVFRNDWSFNSWDREEEAARQAERERNQAAAEAAQKAADDAVNNLQSGMYDDTINNIEENAPTNSQWSGETIEYEY